MSKLITYRVRSLASFNLVATESSIEFKELEVKMVLDFFPFNKDARGINNLGGSENSWPGLSSAKFSTQLTAAIITNICQKQQSIPKKKTVKITPFKYGEDKKIGATEGNIK